MSALQRKEPIKKSSRINRLNPQLQEGILCVEGRLSRASMPAKTKHPMLLLKDHCVADLILHDARELLGHSGCNHVLPMYVKDTGLLTLPHNQKNAVLLYYLSMTTWCIRHTNDGRLTKKQSCTGQTTFYQNWSGSVRTIRCKTWQIICKKVCCHIYLPHKSSRPHQNGNIAGYRLLNLRSVSLHCEERSSVCTFPLRPYTYAEYSVDLGGMESVLESYGSKRFSYLLFSD